jgi:3-deoxy-D-manno-octulosonate 8-phosphate phosphatase (KDO 8-P phosphatase)
MSLELRARAAAVRLLALDVDGVLTDGRLVYGDSGEQLKAFHVRDGLGLRLLMDAGISVAVISARDSAPLRARVRELGLSHLLAGRDDKLQALDELLAQVQLPESACAFVGDDVIDLPVLRRVGLAVSVADAHPLVRASAHWVTQAGGGRGAVREVCDLVLEHQGGLVTHVESFLARRGARGGRA